MSPNRFEELHDDLNRFAQTDLNGIFDNNPGELMELLETGSVTLKILGKSWVLSLHVEEGD